MMSLDMRGDLGVEHVRTSIASLKALAKISGRDILMHGLQQMNAAPLRRRQTQACEVRQRKSRAAHHNPLRKFQQPLRLVPTPKIEEAVCANQVEQPRIGYGLM